MNSSVIYQIVLMEGTETIKEFNFPMIPNVGDSITLSEDSFFKVEQRLLPTEEAYNSLSVISIPIFKIGLTGSVVKMTSEDGSKIDSNKESNSKYWTTQERGPG